MQKSAVMAAVLALGMGFSAVAQAQPHGDHRRGPPPPPHAHGHHKGPPPGHAKKHHDMHRHGPGHGPRAHHHRGAGPEHRWVQGYRLPPQYRTRQYVVNDWRAHRLAPPPRGHQWVQYGGDYMLVAVASGVITQLILHSMR